MGESRAARWVGVLLTVTIVLLGLLTAGVAAIAYWWHRQTTPPDVAAVAESPAVEQAARRAVAVVDHPLTVAVSTAPWLSSVSAGFEDVCAAQHSPFFGGGYLPVRCTRTAVRVMAADEAAVGRGAAWDRALRRAGWVGHDTDGTGSAGPPGRHAYRHTTAGVELTILWVRSPDDPLPSLSLRDVLDPATAVHRAEVPVDEAAVRAAGARFRYLVVLRTALDYHDDQRHVTPTPIRGCQETDSARCPGG